MTRCEYSKRYKERNKLRGLCVDCGRKRNSGKWRCDVCKRKWSLRRMELYPLYCRDCKKPINSEERTRGRSTHKKCTEKKNPQQHRLAALAYQRRHKEKVLCTRCPKKAFKGGRCKKHYRMERKRQLDKLTS